MNKILTISIAAYNVAEFILDTLISVCSIDKNTLDKIEIIVVNDGSKDNTLKIVQEFSKNYPDSVVVVNKENGGYGSTINASLKIARGKYYKLLDGDDWFNTDKLTELVEFLEKTDLDIVLTQYITRFEDESDDVLIEQPYPYHQELPVSFLVQYSMHALTIKTANIQNKISITENCFYTDSEFFIKSAINSHSFVSIPIAVYLYRMGRAGQSVDVTSLMKHYDNWFFVANELVNIYKSNSVITGMKESIYSLLVSSLHICVQLPKSKNNIEKFYSCIAVIDDNWSEVRGLLSLKQKIIVKAPWLYKIYKELI